MNKISRRNFLKVAGAGVAAMGLAACGGSSSSSSSVAASSTAANAAADTLSGTIEYWSSWSETENQALVLKQAADAFTQLHPNVKINFTFNGRDNRNLVVSAIEAGTQIDLMDANIDNEVHVKNCGDENMRCGIGFHPGFNIPFDENHTTTDYEIRFEQEESPIILDCLPHGLLSGKSFYQWKNTQAIPLTDTLFDNDSFCLAGLRSKTIGIYEKNSERKIICDISEYPYTLLWSAPTKPMRFICIEPWQSLPAAETDTSEWNEHAAAACIAPNESYSITLHTTFER